MFPAIYLSAALLALGLNSCSLPVETTVEHPATDTPRLAQPSADSASASLLTQIVTGKANRPPVAAPSHSELWNSLRSGFQLPDEDQAQTLAAQTRYLQHVASLQSVLERAVPYLPWIMAEVEKRGMPMEIALLPAVESAYDPFAYSHGRAAGLWQFIPTTGQRFGLEQNWWYDGRRDVMASTRAALDYLSLLNEQFDGDWLLSLAAYNSGGGTVRKAIRRNRQKDQPTDFWHLSLPRETSHYVPKLLALRNLVRDAERHGLALPDMDGQAPLVSVDPGGQIDLALAAELAALPIADLYRLNPGFNRWATPPEGPHTLLLPESHAQQFKQSLAQLDPAQRIRWERHQIQGGETLSQIAQQYNTTLKVLQKANKLRNNGIRAGDHLLIPVARKELNQYALSAEQRQQKTRQRARGAQGITHVVAEGDNLWNLSRQYGVSVRQLAAWNGMAPGDILKPGMKLAIRLAATDTPTRPLVSAALPADTLRPIHYTIRDGDSLSAISERFKVSVRDLRKWNPAAARNKLLRPGQRLKLYVDVTRQTEQG